MDGNGIFIPKKSAFKDSKNGFPSSFWSKYWDEEEIVTELEFDTTRTELKGQVVSLLDRTSSDHIYAEIKLKPNATSKTMKPSRLWEEADLEFIESRSDGTSVTLSGKRDDFRRLEKIINKADYNIAKSGLDAQGNKVTGKTRDTYREVYAVASVESRNTGIENRVDKLIKAFLESSSNDAIECVIELRSDVDSFEYEKLHEILDENTEGEVFLRDPDLFFSNMSYLAKLKVYEIKALLSSENFSYIRKIKQRPSYEIQRSPSHIQIDSSSVLQPITRLTMGIIDSGIDHNLLNPLRAHHLNRTSLKSNTAHGTFVASRAIFGHDLSLYASGKINTLEPVGKFIDIQVMGDKLIDSETVTTLDDIQDLIGAVKEVVRRHTDVKVFNIAIAEKCAIDHDEVSDLTITLDELSNQYDVLFIISAGNHQVHKQLTYRDIFLNDGNQYDVNIASPADSINNLAVGAVAYDIDDESMTPVKHYPSPFSRVGPGRFEILKPELVEEGGDYLNAPQLDDTVRDFRSIDKYGVMGLEAGKTFAKDLGNSQAAPLVSWQALQLQEYIEDQLSGNLPVRGNYANLMRAMLAHSTAFNEQVGIAKADVHVRPAHGLGVPNFETIFASDDNRVTMVYCDELDFSQKVHKLRFNLPKYLLGTKSKFVLSLAYNPPVDANIEDEYNLISLTASLRAIPPPVMVDGKLKEEPIPIGHGTSDASWRNSRNERATLWHYASATKKELKSDVLEVLIQLNANPKLDKKFSKVEKRKEKQPYALVLSVIDESKSNKLRGEITNSQQFEFVSRNKIQVKQEG